MNATAKPGQDAPAEWSRAAPAGLFALANAPGAALLVVLLSEGASPAARALGAASLLIGAAGASLLLAQCLGRGRRLLHARTQCREHAARLGAVVEAAPHAVLGVNGDSVILSCNRSGAKLFGYRPEDLVGQPLAKLLPEEVARRATDAKTDEQRCLGGGPVGLRRDGSRFPASLSVSKTRIGDAPYYVVLVHDLTELNQARHAAASAARAKTSLLRRVNHELRTPLGGILGTIELLRESPGCGQARHLDTVQESAESLLAVFNQLVDHARLEAGQVELARQPFSLRRTLEQTLAPLLPLARSRGLRLDARFGADLPDQFLGDPARLGQLLASLVGNAVKFTPAGEVLVRVGGERRGDTVALTFEVIDTGIGIEPAQLERLFEPFEQGDGSATRRHGGLGLGLTVAARLADLMGGKIDVRSEPGRGSRFRFAVPLEAAGAVDGLGAVLVVLACDDDRSALLTQLSEWGVAAAGARSGRQALTELFRAVVEGAPFGLVLIEEHLPDLSAREVLSRLRHRSDAPPAVLLGHSEADVPLPDGVRAVLPRRVDAPRLYQAVVASLGTTAPFPPTPAAG